MIKRYEIASVDGVGFLLFSIAENGKQQRVGGVFGSVDEAHAHIPATHRNHVDLVDHSAAGSVLGSVIAPTRIPLTANQLMPSSP